MQRLYGRSVDVRSVLCLKKRPKVLSALEDFSSACWTLEWAGKPTSVRQSKFGPRGALLLSGTRSQRSGATNETCYRHERQDRAAVKAAVAGVVEAHCRRRRCTQASQGTPI